MATYKGRKVTLNKPRRIGKGEPSYGKKKSVVYVKDGDKVNRVTFGDQKQRQDIGLVRHGDMTRAAIKKVAQAEIRAAKSFLEKRGIKSEEVSPRKFAKAAKELDKGFQDTLKILARELSGGQV